MSRLVIPVLALAAALLTNSALADRHEKHDEAAPATQADRDGFEPIDPESLEQVDGARLVIIAYAFIVGAIFLYCLVLLLRERATHRAVHRLRDAIDAHHRR
jgi:hypothetical protein